MAKPTVTISDVEELEKSVKDLTSLSQSLKDVFTKINRETDVLGQGFKDIVSKASTNVNLAERYLISQRLQESVQNRINEIKSKSSYLDSVGLQFKREETQLQMRIAAAQIRALQSQIAIQGINNRERLRAIEALKIQNVLRGAELRYVTTSANNQSQVVASLNAQLTAIRGFTPALERNNRISNAFKNIFGDSVNSMGDFSKLLSGTLPTYKDIIAKGVKMFLEFDKASFTLRKTFGFLRGEFSILEKNVKDVAIELADFGVTFDNVVAATSAIGKEFNALVAANKNLVKDVSVLSVQLGIAETESAKFLKSISAMSRSTVASQKGMVGFAKEMANAAGVPLDAVMKDVADASEEVRIYTGSSVVNLIKGAAEARLMGTTFQKMADTAKKLLDFNTSINDEIEASVLLGTNVTFQRARELAYQKNILEANKEILKIAKGMNFDAMDPFQAEAFAKASGKTVTELQEMIQADKEIQHIRRFGTAEQVKQLENMEKLKRDREIESKDIGKQAELKLRQMANQERINQLQNQFNKLMMELAKPVMDVVEPLLLLSTKILPPALELIKLITLASGAILGPWLYIIKPINAFVKALQYGQGIMKSFSAFGVSISRSFNFFSRFSGFLGVFSKFLGPIGLIVTAFQAIAGFIDGFNKTEGNFGEKLWGGLVGGLKAVVQPIFDLLMWPINAFKKWFMNDSGMAANSPSEIGLAILHGIKSIGASLLDAITAPFRTGFNLISGLIGGPTLPSFSDIINKTSETGISPTTTNAASTNELSINQSSIIGAIKQGIKEGIGNMTINVDLDGQKMITGISKNVGFRSDTGGVAMQTSLT